MTNDLTCPSGVARCVNTQCVQPEAKRLAPAHTNTLFVPSKLPFFKQVLLIFFPTFIFWTEGSSFVGRPVFFFFCFVLVPVVFLSSHLANLTVGPE